MFSRSRAAIAITLAALLTLVGVLGTAGSAAEVHASQRAGGKPAADRYTPALMHVFSSPQWFRDTDGTYQLVYELELSNPLPVEVEATKLIVRNAETGRPIARLAGEELTATMSPLGGGYTSPSRKIVPGGVSIVWVEVPLKSRERIPAKIKHTLTVRLPPGLPISQSITDTGGAAKVKLQSPVVIAPPVSGPGWVAAGSCCDGPHRRALQPINGHLTLGQRFAIDFNRGNAKGRWVIGNPDIAANWIFYGDPVRAVADGVVVEAVDRYRDQIPNHENPVGLAKADGNHVIVRFGKGLYAGYAHLKPGSVRVRPGETVRRGQVIGRLGNSGSSDGPHLHFQVMDKPSLVDAEGLPFAFAQFTLEGKIPPLNEELAIQINAGESIPVDPAGAGPRHDELPIGRDVVSFP